MRILEVMSSGVVTVGPSETARAAWTRMRRRGIRHLVVMDDRQLIGVLSERDLGGPAGARIRKNHVVRELMTPRVDSIDPEAMLDDAAALMRARLIGSLPVMDGDDLVGIITATDVFEALGRETVGYVPRARSSVSSRDTRASLTDQVPRPTKRRAGRTSASQVPANIRVAGLELDDDDRAYIRKRLGMKLGKFATSIERVTVRVRDINGNRGGIDKVCNIKVVLSGLPSVVFESRSASLKVAVNAALAGVERTVRRGVQRRRSRPLKAGAVGKAGR